MRPAVLITAALVVAMALGVALFGSPYLTAHVTRMLVYAIFAMSLDLLIGYCGLVSLGHAAFFGIGGYTTAVLAAKLQITNVLVGLPVSILTAALGALAIGLLTLRTKGIYFIMATLAFAEMVYFFVNDSDFLGGSDGLLVRARFRLDIGSLVSLDASDRTVTFVIALVAAALTFIGLFLFVRSPFGRVLQGIRSNEKRMRALGYPVARYKLACFVIGGALAGLAGHLHVLLTSLADPSILDWLHSAQVLMMVIIGGLGSLIGPAIGAFVLIELIDQAAELTEHWKLIVGVTVIAVTLFGKGGLVGLGSALAARFHGAKVGA